MKKIVLVCLLLLTYNYLFAQDKKSKPFKRDTINLRGYIYDADGKPIKYLNIQSAQREVTYNEFKVGATTDTSGYFELKELNCMIR